MTVNANFKTQVQARIDAVTGTTPLSDLIKLQTAARGLACNIAPLAAQINARLSAAGGATPLTDLAMLGILAEGNSRYAYYTVPFAVDKGDRLFIDAFGAVTKDVSPATSVAGNTFPAFSEVPWFAAIPQRAVRPYSRVQEVNSKVGAGAVLQLANGNWMVVRSYRQATNSYGSVYVAVLNSTFSALLSEFTFDVSSNTSSLNVFIIGAFETSANTFRVYFIAPDESASEQWYRVVRSFTLAYNPVSHAVNGASAATVFTGSLATNYDVVLHPHKQGDRYLIVAGSSGSTDVRRLDMQTGTATSTTVAVGASFAAPDHSASTNVYTRMIAGGVVTLLQLDGTNNLALPANLAADGCFGTGFAVRHIGQRRWLCASGSTLKLVVFNTTYTTCSIFTLDSAFGAVGPVSIDAVIADGDRFYVGIQAAMPVMISFVFNGAAAPTQYMKLSATGVQVAQILATLRRAPNISSTDRVVCSTGFFADSVNTTARVMALTVRASIYTGLRCRQFATCLTSAAAGQVAEIELANGTELATAPTASAVVKPHQFLETTLSTARPRVPTSTAVFDTQPNLAANIPSVAVGSSLLQLTPFVSYNFSSTDVNNRIVTLTPHYDRHTAITGSPQNEVLQATETTCVFTTPNTRLVAEEPLA